MPLKLMLWASRSVFVCAFTWEGNFSFECVSTYWNQLVILAVYNNTEYSPWLFKYVTYVPVNYSELQANSMKYGSSDASHLSVITL